MTHESILVSKKIAAKLLGVSIGLIDKLRRQGKLQSVSLGKRAMFRRADIEALAMTPAQRRVFEQECGPGAQ
jgi:hypothetical protein